MLIFAPDISVALRIVDRRQFIRVTFRSLEGDGPKATAAWARELTRIDFEPNGKGILIPDLDYNFSDPKSMALKLRFLESVCNVHTRTVVAITTISPQALMDVASEQPELAVRWRAVLSTFNIRIEDGFIARGRRRTASIAAAVPAGLTRRTQLPKPLAQLIERPDVQRIINGSPEHAHALIAQETADGGDFLVKLGAELRDRIRGREEIYDEIGERAAMHYAGLWASCSGVEKAVLCHIAQDGFANAKDRRTIRRLLARGLIRRAPNFRVMNETFRRFIVCHDRRAEVAAFEKRDGRENPWAKIQKPLTVGLVMAGGFFFFTQRELFDASFAVVTGIAGGVPTLLKVVGIFSGGKEAAAR
jgi:hypothetical protein